MCPISVDEVGINLLGTPPTLLQEIEVEAVLEETEPVLESDGTLHTHAGDAFGLKKSIKMKGKGDFPVALALASDGGLDHDLVDSGVTIVTRIKTAEGADKHNTWEADAENRPEAGEVASSA